MRLRDHIYEYDTIVIGGTLDAVVYSFLNSVPIVYLDAKFPFRFDFTSDDINFFGFKSAVREPEAKDSTIRVGGSKLLLYKHILFALSLSGLVPYSDKVQSLSIEKDRLKVVTGTHGIFKIKFNKLFIFDEEGISGLPSPSEKIEKVYKVYDWIDVRSGMNHPHDYIETGDDFVRELYFYPSDRIDGHHANRKDLVIASYMTEEQLNDIDYSDFYSRFKAEEVMKQAGIRGRANGRRNGKRLFRSLKLEPSYREVFTVTRDIYENTESLFFHNEPLEQIMKKKDLVDESSYVFDINRKMHLK